MNFYIKELGQFPDGRRHTPNQAAWDEAACLLLDGKAIVIPLDGRSSQSVRSFAARMLAERGVAITTRTAADELWIKAK